MSLFFLLKVTDSRLFCSSYQSLYELQFCIRSFAGFINPIKILIQIVQYFSSLPSCIAWLVRVPTWRWSTPVGQRSTSVRSGASRSPSTRSTHRVTSRSSSWSSASVTVFVILLHPRKLSISYSTYLRVLKTRFRQICLTLTSSVPYGKLGFGSVMGIPTPYVREPQKGLFLGIPLNRKSPENGESA